MKHTKEEIINALNVIRDECIGTNCIDCPFASGVGDCRLIERSPSRWDIAELEPKKWRALK